MPYNNNPTGRNQHGDVAKADNEELVAALQKYHREKLTNNSLIASRLFADHGIRMSNTTVKRRRCELGLVGSRSTAKTLPYEDAEQLVLSQLEKDPLQKQGVAAIQNRVAYHNGIHVKRDLVSNIMHIHAPEGFDVREPTAKKIRRFPKYPIGIHERWAADGHDKLYGIGFPIWAIVDDATGRWLGAWVVPSNRMGAIVAYCFLSLVEEYGGIPLQFTTDHGSETTQIFGLVNALRATFHPEYNNDELPAHVYLRSVHNIAIERAWLRMRLAMGDSAVHFYKKGIEDARCNLENPDEYELSRWLWAKVLRKEIQVFMDFHNGQKMRKDKDKPGPSGMSRNTAFSLYEEWGGRNCLLPVDVDVVRVLKEGLGGDQLLDFTSAEFSEQAQAVYDGLLVGELTFENTWDVFDAMCPIMFDDNVDDQVE